MLAIALMVSALVLPGAPAARCTHAQLRLHVGRVNGTAGTIYYPVVFTTTGERACALRGYPGVSPVTGPHGRQIGDAAARDLFAVARVLLRAHSGAATAVYGQVDTGVYRLHHRDRAGGRWDAGWRSRPLCAGVACASMAVGDDVGLVRAVWVAARENDVDTLVDLTAPDVEWCPTAVNGGALHGHDALRGYLDGLRAAGTLVDAHAYSFEAVGGCVIVSGALCLRRQDGPAESVQRWWVYRVAHGKLASVVSHASRDDACRDARAQHLEVHGSA